MSLTRMRVWRSFFTRIDFLLLPRSRRAGRFSQQDLGIAWNEKIRHGADFPVALLAVEGACPVIKIRHAGEQVFGPRKRERLDMGQQPAAEAPASCGRGDPE